jgi:hypothetical protein
VLAPSPVLSEESDSVLRPLNLQPNTSLKKVSRTLLTLLELPTDPSSYATGFNAPFWRNLSLAAIGIALYLRIAPSTSTDDDSEPWLTRYIAHNLNPTADKFKERNEKHLEAAKQLADDKLLFQEAEKPRVKRMRYLGSVHLLSCAVEADGGF